MEETANAVKNASVYRPESTSKMKRRKISEKFSPFMYYWVQVTRGFHQTFYLRKRKRQQRWNTSYFVLGFCVGFCFCFVWVFLGGCFGFFWNCSSSLINCYAKILLTQQNCCHGNISPATLLTSVTHSRVCHSPIPSALACIYSAPLRRYNGLPSLDIIPVVFAFQISHSVWEPWKPMGKTIEETEFDLQSL